MCYFKINIHESHIAVHTLTTWTAKLVRWLQEQATVPVESGPPPEITHPSVVQLPRPPVHNKSKIQSQCSSLICYGLLPPNYENSNLTSNIFIP